MWVLDGCIFESLIDHFVHPMGNKQNNSVNLIFDTFDILSSSMASHRNDIARKIKPKRNGEKKNVKNLHIRSMGSTTPMTI